MKHGPYQEKSAMFLQRVKNKATGKTYLYLMEVTSAKNSAGEVVHINKKVKSFGNEDKFKQEKPEEYKLLIDQYSRANVKAAVELHKSQTLAETLKDMTSSGLLSLPNGTTPVFCYGLSVIKQIWNKLNLDYKLSYIRQHDTDIKFKAEDVVFYLAGIKIIDPASHLQAYQSRFSYLGAPAENVSLEDFYRSLDFIADAKEKVMKHLHKEVSRITGRDLKMVFFDCTNTYFETRLDDQEKLIRKLTHETSGMMEQEGRTQEEIEKYLESAEFAEELKNEAERLDLKRMRGPSKEKRIDLPLVGIALIIDTNGIPVDFEVYDGNRSEFKIAVPAIRKLADKYGVEDCIFVADRGINSAVNLKDLHDSGFGFIVAQKVSRQGTKLREAMQSSDGWTKLNDDLRYKAIPWVKSKVIVDPETGDSKTVSVKCTLVLTYSESRKKSDAVANDRQIERARAAVSSGEVVGYKSVGWKELVEVSSEKDEYVAVSLKDELIKERRLREGFAACVYASADKSKQQITPETAIAAYKRQVKIEDCFRIMKTNFSLRPMYVWNPRHIRGHVTICVIALVILRLLQLRLDKNGVHMSTDDIVDALDNARLTLLASAGRNDLYLNASSIHDFSQLNALKDSTAVGQKAAEEDHDDVKRGINDLLACTGLKPLKTVNLLSDLNNCLKARMPSREAAIGELVSSNLRAVYQQCM